MAIAKLPLVSVQESVISALLGKGKDNGQDYAKLVARFESLLRKCTDLGASDLHIVALPSGVSVKARVLGELNLIARFDFDDMSKTLASLYNNHAQIQSKDLTFDPSKEQRTTIPMMIGDRQFQLRYESVPINPNDAYRVVIRFHDPQASIKYKSIASLGYSSDQVKLIDKAIKCDHGLMIISGETGSGKTTTLATMLTNIYELWGSRIAISSVESPVEYWIEGVAQIPVHQGINDTHEDIANRFARKISGLLRSDPDVLMIGEVSDVFTAKALQQAVQSGAKTLTTIHTSSALRVLGRLVGLGLEKDVVAEPDFLKLIIHQKPIPILCDQCALPVETIKGDDLYKDIQALAKRYSLMRKLPNVKIRNTSGKCSKCRDHNGIVALEVIAEVIEPSVPMLNALKNSDLEGAHQIWRKNNGVSYQERGIYKMFEGRVCPRELERKIGSLCDDGTLSHIDKAFYNKVMEVCHD